MFNYYKYITQSYYHFVRLTIKKPRGRNFGFSWVELIIGIELKLNNNIGKEINSNGNIE